MSRRDNPAAKVIVRSYPLSTPERELRDMFEKIGKIDDCECADSCMYAQYNSTLLHYSAVQYNTTVDIRTSRSRIF